MEEDPQYISMNLARHGMLLADSRYQDHALFFDTYIHYTKIGNHINWHSISDSASFSLDRVSIGDGRVDDVLKNAKELIEGAVLGPDRAVDFSHADMVKTYKGGVIKTIAGRSAGKASDLSADCLLASSGYRSGYRRSYFCKVGRQGRRTRKN